MKTFLDRKEEKITEKAFSQALIVSVFSILLCIVVLCSVTYAWFSESVVSDVNTIASGHFAFDGISVVKTGSGEDILVETPVMTDGAYIYSLEPGIYKITLQLDESAKAKGHCIVEIYGEQKHTEAIIGENTANKDGYEVNLPFEFSLKIEENAAEVKFKPVWGVSVETDIAADANEPYLSSDWVTATGE